MKIFDISSFPDFPLPSYQVDGLQLNLTEDESLIIESFAVDRNQSISIEKNTREQSNNPVGKFKKIPPHCIKEFQTNLLT